MLKLYVSDDGKTFTELSAVAVAPHLKPIKKTSVKDAILKYDQNCTSHKCIKNRSNERLYFKMFRDFAEGHGIINVDEVTAVLVEDFQSMLYDRMSGASVNRRFNTFKHFFRKCLEWKFIFENPAAGIKKKKEESKPFKPWPTEIVAQFLLLTTDVHTDLFYFLWLTGCRPMEAKNLMWTDIDHDAGEITFKCGKNAKVTRKFPITDEISSLLHQMKMDSIYVFSKDKKQITNQLLYHYAKDRLKQFTRENYTVYGLRHTFGSRMSENGANAFEVAQLMGHTKIETTKRYIHTDQQRFKNFISK
jgi:integrase/recombinase XerD